MARRPKRSKASNVEVRVPVPEDTSVRVTDLKKLSDKDLTDLIKKAKTAKVGFVILNAPFKVRPI